MSLFSCQKSAAQTGPVTYLQYRLSEMRNRTEYIFERTEDGTCYLTRILGYRDEEGKKVQVPEATAEELWQIIQEEKMTKYKDRYTPKCDIRDGYMWLLDVRFKEGKLYTGGDNVMPDGGKGIHRLEKYLENLWEKMVPPVAEHLEYPVVWRSQYGTLNLNMIGKTSNIGSSTPLSAIARKHGV